MINKYRYNQPKFTYKPPNNKWYKEKNKDEEESIGLSMPIDVDSTLDHQTATSNVVYKPIYSNKYWWWSGSKKYPNHDPRNEKKSENIVGWEVKSRLAVADPANRVLLQCEKSEPYFCHNLRTVTLIYAQLEALEILFNDLYYNE